MHSKRPKMLMVALPKHGLNWVWAALAILLLVVIYANFEAIVEALAPLLMLLVCGLILGGPVVLFLGGIGVLVAILNALNKK